MNKKGLDAFIKSVIVNDSFKNELRYQYILALDVLAL